jgi:very-short-patch-repair endonuclease
MKPLTKIPDNVWRFMDKASDDYGRIASARFSQDMHCQIVEIEIASPIEQMFLIAMHVMCAANFDKVNPAPIEDSADKLTLGFGVHIFPQERIGRYTVDFLVKRTGFYGDVTGEVIVELDGHDFHDKDKRQRSYEKARDRFLVKSGYKVLHFTGSDVVADPYKVAHEVMDTIECFGGVGAAPYKKDDPFSNGGLY